MTEYPIPVKRLAGKKALTIICERCATEAVIHPDDIQTEGLYRCPADIELARKASTAPRCRGSAVMKYEQADECPGCGKLGYFGGRHDELKGCCSRRCLLQVEWVRERRSLA